MSSHRAGKGSHGGIAKAGKVRKMTLDRGGNMGKERKSPCPRVGNRKRFKRLVYQDNEKSLEGMDRSTRKRRLKALVHDLMYDIGDV